MFFRVCRTPSSSSSSVGRCRDDLFSWCSSARTTSSKISFTISDRGFFCIFKKISEWNFRTFSRWNIKAKFQLLEKRDCLHWWLQMTDGLIIDCGNAMTAFWLDSCVQGKSLQPGVGHAGVLQEGPHRRGESSRGQTSGLGFFSSMKMRMIFLF